MDQSKISGKQTAAGLVRKVLQAGTGLTLKH